MTTYNTYQEAKIAMPLACIIHDTDDDIFFGMPSREGTTLNDDGCKFAEPHDYCMTVEKFLADGHKFKFGDLIVSLTGTVSKVNIEWIVNESISEVDRKYFILRAATLEEKKPRTKVEYVQVLDCIFNLKSDYENGNLYHSYDGKEFSEIKGDERTVARCLVECNLYRRIETPITWKEELYNYLDNSCEMSDDFDGSFTIEIEGRPLEFNLNDDEFVDMCKLVASLNSVN